jgi:acyl carrier protein
MMSNLPGSTRSRQEVQDWIVAKLSEMLEIDEAEIDVTAPITRYGADSARLIEIAAELEKWLGSSVDDELLQDNPNIQSLVNQLVPG